MGHWRRPMSCQSSPEEEWKDYIETSCSSDSEKTRPSITHGAESCPDASGSASVVFDPDLHSQPPALRRWMLEACSIKGFNLRIVKAKIIFVTAWRHALPWFVPAVCLPWNLFLLCTLNPDCWKNCAQRWLRLSMNLNFKVLYWFWPWV